MEWGSAVVFQQLELAPATARYSRRGSLKARDADYFPRRLSHAEGAKAHGRRLG